MKLKGIDYCKQIRDKDCFPTAYANAMKWAGEQFSYKNIREILYTKFGTTNEIGTLLDNVEIVFSKSSKHAFKVNKVKTKTTFEDIKKHIENGGSVIYTFMTDGGGFHSAFIVDIYDINHFYIVNYHTGYTLSIVPRSVINNNLKTEVICAFISRKS
jgi:hypothetical protein